MKKFMLLFVRLTKPDVATQQKLGSEWMNTIPKGTVEAAFPFSYEGKILHKKASKSHTKEGFNYGGYMIVNAVSSEKAIALAQTSPHMKMGGKIVVRQMLSA